MHRQRLHGRRQRRLWPHIRATRRRGPRPTKPLAALAAHTGAARRRGTLQTTPAAERKKRGACMSAGFQTEGASLGCLRRPAATCSRRALQSGFAGTHPAVATCSRRVGDVRLYSWLRITSSCDLLCLDLATCGDARARDAPRLRLFWLLLLAATCPRRACDMLPSSGCLLLCCLLLHVHFCLACSVLS